HRIAASCAFGPAWATFRFQRNSLTRSWDRAADESDRLQGKTNFPNMDEAALLCLLPFAWNRPSGPRLQLLCLCRLARLSSASSREIQASQASIGTAYRVARRSAWTSSSAALGTQGDRCPGRLRRKPAASRGSHF